MTDLTIVLPAPQSVPGAARRTPVDPISLLREAGLDVPAGTTIHLAYDAAEDTDTPTVEDLFHTVGG